MKSFRLETKKDKKNYINNQVENYNTLGIIHSARGKATLLIVIFSLFSLAFSYFEEINFYEIIPFLIVYWVFALFIYKGHRWAIIGTMILWILDKVLQISYQHQAALSIIIGWFVLIIPLYQALKIENERKRRLIEAKSVLNNNSKDTDGTRSNAQKDNGFKTNEKIILSEKNYKIPSGLVDTNLQKVILLVGGLAVFIKLLTANGFNKYETIFFSLGVAIFTFVLLVVARGYTLTKEVTYTVIALVSIIALLASIFCYLPYREKQEAAKQQRAYEEKYHQAEVSYQNCLDKVSAEISTVTEHHDPSSRCPSINREETLILYQSMCSTTKTRNIQTYMDEWQKAGSPHYNSGKGYWQFGFMKWMMENHKDFCNEFNTDNIDYFLSNRFQELQL